MWKPRRPWQEELAIIDGAMRAISGETDPERLVEVYWRHVGELVSVEDYVALSRRNVEPPHYLITRSSRFVEHFNPWTERERLPRLSGGLLGEIAFANRPVIIEDLPARLADDDPAHFYLQGFQALIALPQYDAGEALNVTILLVPEGESLDQVMIPMMHWQSGLFGRGTQNLVLRNQLSAALSALDRELQVVGAIQRSLLPSQLPPIPGFELAAHYETSARAGGDYYDFFPLEGGRWGVFIGDVAGHGTPAAVLMAITHAIAHSQPGSHTPPATLLAYLNRQLTRAYTHDGLFVTAFYGVLDPQARTLTYSRAGHNPPRLARGGQVIALDGAGALPLGILESLQYEETQVQLAPGDLLLLFTDGVVEASPAETFAAETNGDAAAGNGSFASSQFGTERLDALLLDCLERDSQECLDRIRAAVSEHCAGAPATDDQTLIALRCL